MDGPEDYNRSSQILIISTRIIELIDQLENYNLPIFNQREFRWIQSDSFQCMKKMCVCVCVCVCVCMCVCEY